MPKPFSQDLRHRIVAAVEAGGGMRAVAARYDVIPMPIEHDS
jgi:transposase-like protein